MRSPIDRVIASITEDLRRDYLWDPLAASRATHLHPNKFGTWWYATRGKLIDLFVLMPGETAAELAFLLAIAEQERQRQMQSVNPPPCPTSSPPSTNSLMRPSG